MSNIETDFDVELTPTITSIDRTAVFSYERIRHAAGTEYNSVIALLGPGQRAWNPVSTKEERMIFGPAVVIYHGLHDRSGTRAIVF